MSKPTKEAPKGPVVTVDASEKGQVQPGDSYELPREITVPVRISRGNNQHDLVLMTFPTTPTKVRVLRSRRSRMEVDYELKVKMMDFLGPNRFGPSESM